MGKLEHYDKAVFDRLLCEVLVKAGDFNSQNIANCLNAMGKLEHYDKAVFDRLAVVRGAGESR
jgi:hypothetical protein